MTFSSNSYLLRKDAREKDLTFDIHVNIDLKNNDECIYVC